MAPLGILMAVFVFLVFIRGFLISLTDAQGINHGSFIGLANFKAIAADRQFWTTVLTTLEFAGACLITQLPAAFLLASWLRTVRSQRIQAVLSAAFLVPFLMNSVVTALLFRMLFAEPGIVNWLLGLLHLPDQVRWVFDPEVSFGLLVGVAFWQGIGFPTIYFLTAFQAIDPTIYEAATLDGASAPVRFLRITVPLMRPAVTFLAVTSAVGSLVVFDLVFLLFQQGVNDNVRSILIYIYGKAYFGNLELGLGAAAGWIAFFIILVVSLLQLNVLGLGKPQEE